MFISMSCVTVKKEAVVFASMETSWNSLFQVLVSPIFSHPFKIIICLLFNFFHALCNHSQFHGFKLFILKSTLGFLPLSIYYLMTLIVQFFNFILNACLSGCYKMISFGQRMLDNLLEQKQPKYLDVFLLSSPRLFDFCVHSNNLITKLVFDVFAIPLTQSKLGGKEPWHSPQSVWQYQTLTNDSHCKLNPTHQHHLLWWA